MKVFYTSKLFFKKYNTRIIIETKSKHVFLLDNNVKEVISEKKWCDKNLNDFKLKNFYWGKIINQIDNTVEGTKWHQMIYISGEDQKKKLLKRYKDRVIEITQPYNNDHKESLDVRNITEIRSKLIYDKYQYCVYFKYDNDNSLANWLSAFFKDEDPTTYSLKIKRYTPTIYLKDEGHLITLKLMWQDKIDYVKTIRLITG
jgi:hypothetical protein